MSYSASVINVYKFVDADTYLRYSSDLAYLLFGIKATDDPQIKFSISPGSGWISYSNRNEIFRDRKPMSLPPNEKIAEVAALKILKQKKDKLLDGTKRKKELERIFLQNLIPSDVKLISSQAVIHPRNTWIDHWLLRFGISLSPNFEEKKIPVQGATIEMRIGDGGKLIGMWIRWRPYESKKETSYLPYIEMEEEHQPPQLVYFMGDDGVPQTTLCPFYFSLSGHHGSIEPASAQSLMVDIFQINEKDSIKLICIPKGGSGLYEFQWAYWKPDTVLEEGLVGINGQTTLLKIANNESIEISSVEVKQAIYNMIVNVIDRETKVNYFYQKMIFMLQNPSANSIKQPL